MTAGGEGSLSIVMERLNAALNAHNLEAFLACFQDDYESEQPAHPDRAFRGREQVRSNWSAVFDGVPDFRSELLRSAADGDTVWSEWHWRGTQSDGTPLDMVGVFVCGVREGRISWARLYMEPVEQAGAGIESAVRRMTGDE
jgi:ketosteroid isomerase-like protein